MSGVHPGVLAGVSVWRLVVAASALTGFWLSYEGSNPSLAYLTLQSNLLTGLVFVALLVYPALVRGRRYEPGSGWIRGAVALLMTLVCVTYMTMLGGDVHELRNLLAHLITPILVTLDWLVVGSAPGRSRWWYPLSWLVLPIAYLVFYIAYGQVLYGFLDPHAADFWTTVLSFLLAVTAAGYALYGLAKLRLIGTARQPAAGPGRAR